MTQTIKVQRKDFINQLSGIKEDNISIAGIAINRRKLLDTLKLQTQPDADILNIQYGNVSWTDKYKPQYDSGLRNDTWHESKVENEPCIQISCDHTIMRFLNKPKVKGWNNELVNIIPLNFVDHQNYKPPVLSGVLIDIPELLNALNYTLSCVATTQDRPALNCVLFESSKGELRLVSADGFRIAIAPIKVKGLKEDNSLIHMTDCARLLTFLKASKPTGKGRSKSYPDLYFSSDKKTATFSTATNNITLIKQDYQFPDFSKVIPKDGNMIAFNSDDMMQAVKSIAYNAKQNGNIIRLQFYQGKPADKIVLSAKHDSHDGEQVSNVECLANVSADCKIAVNYNFLLDVLKHFKQSVIKLSVTTPSSPMKFYLQNNNTAVVMPMFTEW